MREERGDLFKHQADAIVIPINWRTKRSGEAVMGAGVAKVAAARWSWLPRHLGRHITCDRKTVRVFIDRTAKFDEGGPEIIGLPTKYDWRQRSELGLILDGVRDLVQIADTSKWATVALPRVGCGLGGLDWESQVRPLLAERLDNRFVVLTP